MAECEYCSREFSGEKEKLEHELDEHGDEISSHARSDKKSRLNKIEQKEQTSKHHRRKKLQYGAIGVLLLGLIAGGGFYASQNSDSISSVQQNNVSIGVGEPIHWHADYQITVCGENQVLQGGPTTAHTHGETTFHLEGVRTQQQAELDWIVDSLGGQLEEDSIMGRDSCNDEPANLSVKLNGNEVEDHMSLVPRDGDFIRINYS